VKQYPHILKTNSDTTEAAYTNGQWVAGTAESEVQELCRVEPNGGGYLLKPDGNRLDYNWIVYFPHSAPAFVVGTNLKIFDGDDVLILDDTVKQFYRGQFNARVWL